jgi:hypothetical protein
MVDVSKPLCEVEARGWIRREEMDAAVSAVTLTIGCGIGDYTFEFGGGEFAKTRGNRKRGVCWSGGVMG